MCSQKNSSSVRTFTPLVACPLSLDPSQVIADVVFTQGQQNPLHDCTIIYIIIMQWLVGWCRDQGKKGVHMLISVSNWTNKREIVYISTF